jgi:GNAT superfamily N-acetyltransferase
MKDLTLRRYRPEDHEAVLALHYAGVAQIDPGRSTFPRNYDDDLDDIPGVYLDGPGDFLVAEREGELVAIGALRPRTDTCGEIKRMRTRPDLQGRGCGRAILAKLTARARELGYTELFLDTLTTNTQAQRFYERAGFTRSGHGLLGDYELYYYTKTL